MKIAYDFYKSLIVINKNLTKDKFIRFAGVQKNQFAHQVFAEMYDCIFSELRDLELDFEKYYKAEYGNFKRFLYHKYILDHDEIELLSELAESHEDLRIFQREDFSYGNYSLEQFTFSDTMCDRILQSLLKLD